MEQLLYLSTSLSPGRARSTIISGSHGHGRDFSPFDDVTIFHIIYFLKLSGGQQQGERPVYVGKTSLLVLDRLGDDDGRTQKERVKKLVRCRRRHHQSTGCFH